MGDYSSGHITTAEAGRIIRDLDEALSREGVRFYPGTGYRHLMVWAGGPELKTTPPHDITDKRIDDYLPRGEGAHKLIGIMEIAQGILRDHPVNQERRSSGKRPATSVWLWGQGRAPVMPTFRERFGVDGSIISAVDLMKGIGIYAGLKVIDVPGATGYIDTNYRGKAEYALRALDGGDFVCVHVEAPDEAGHNGNLRDKIKAIEDFDREVVGRVLSGAGRFGEFRVAALADHPTPVRLKTHTSDPVPFAVFTSGAPRAGSAKFSEKGAAATGLRLMDGRAFIEGFFGRAEAVLP
jgi:2,3-bisphosphoglycerate-independent phosphoglycerate mutase